MCEGFSEDVCICSAYSGDRKIPEYFRVPPFY